MWSCQVNHTVPVYTPLSYIVSTIDIRPEGHFHLHYKSLIEAFNLRLISIHNYYGAIKLSRYYIIAISQPGPPESVPWATVFQSPN